MLCLGRYTRYLLTILQNKTQSRDMTYLNWKRQCKSMRYNFPIIIAKSFHSRLSISCMETVSATMSDPFYCLLQFFDEIHLLRSSGLEVMKLAMARGEIRCIGATTKSDYEDNIQSKPSVERYPRQWYSPLWTGIPCCSKWVLHSDYWPGMINQYVSNVTEENFVIAELLNPCTYCRCCVSQPRCSICY